MPPVVSRILLSLLLATASLLADVSGSAYADDPLPPQPASLDEAVKAVQEMVKQGRSQEAIAQWVTRVADARITNMNSFERMSEWRNWVKALPAFVVDPNKDPDKVFGDWRDRNIFDYAETAKWVWDNRVGQCSENAALTYYILKTAGVPGNVRIYGAPNHEFTIWGVQEGANPNDPATWGPDARLVDSWLGKTLTPAEAAANKWISNGGQNVIADQTLPFDKEAKAWQVAPEAAGASAQSDCFIATAAFGTPLAEELVALRGFRDRVLRESATGRAWVDWYYWASPPIAEALAKNGLARSAVRERFLRPVVRLLALTQGIWDQSRSATTR